MFLPIYMVILCLFTFCTAAWGNNNLEFDNLWIPDSYQESAQSIALQARTTSMEHILLSHGLAIVMPLPSVEQYTLYKIEEQARTKHLGLWAQPQYSIKTPQTITNYENSFQIVNGIIVDASLRKDYLYLNFGSDWKTDFTIAIPKSSLRHFKKENLIPQDWGGMNISARGWIEKHNGPMMKVTHPAQIRILPE